MLGSVLQCCNDAVFTIGERCHDDKTGRREEEGYLLLTEWPIHSHIGQYERLFVGLPGELYSRCLAHYTLHTVSADQIPGLDPSFTAGTGDRDAHPLLRLLDIGRCRLPLDITTLRGQSIFQNSLCEVLW